MINLLELFSGSRIMSKTFGGKVINIDNEYDCTKPMDLLNPDWDYFKKLKGKVKVIWASPPCTTFSVCTISRHWVSGRHPKTEECKKGIKLLLNTLRIIDIVQPKYWFIENPRGMMRKVIPLPPVIRKTVAYCQYGDFRQKPTDIWTNHSTWTPRKMCNRGDKCHESTSRGINKGTQGMSGAYERSKIPKELCQEIKEICQND